MPARTEAEFSKQLKENIFPRVCILYGDEKADIRKTSDKLIAKLVPKGTEVFNLHAFDADTLDMRLLGEAVYAVPMMADYHCVKISDYDAEKVTASAAEEITQLVRSVPDSTVLLFTLPTLVFNQKKSAKWRNFLKLVAEHGDTVEFPKHDKAYLVRRLCAYAEKNGCNLSKENAARLVDLCGGDQTTLTNEIQKLVFYAKDREITRDDIAQMVPPPLEGTVFNLTNALTASRYDEAFHILNSLFQKREEPIAIFSVLANSWINLYRAKTALDANRQPEALADAFGMKGTAFQLRNAARDARYLSLSQLRASLDILAQTDRKMKSTRTDSKILLEQLLTGLILIKQSA